MGAPHKPIERVDTSFYTAPNCSFRVEPCLDRLVGACTNSDHIGLDLGEPTPFSAPSLYR